MINTGYILSDYTTKYKSIMQFNKNKSIQIHQWYPFVEGYSREFIEDILAEIKYIPLTVLDPFSGSGTTPVELQDQGIKCYSFEVSPFMHLLSSVKMRRDYKLSEFCYYYQEIKGLLSNNPNDIRQFENLPFGKTVVKNEKSTKWNFNDEVIDGILDIKYSIKMLEDDKYQNLFKIALASIILEVSNLFRNGKCLSYKKNWKETVNYSRKNVHELFLTKLDCIFKNDIEIIEQNGYVNDVSNSNFCFYGDVRENIKNLPDNSVDLVITSPPYLNSRDYTDIYMLELKVLDLVKSHEDLQNLRRRTLRSHVQVKHGNLETLEIEKLKQIISQIEQSNQTLWNSDLLNMIKGYFIDMDILFEQLYAKMKPNRKVFFNVANSAYFGIEIFVDEIVAEIAEKRGFKDIEIRKARNLKTSSQQSTSIKHLRESVIVLTS